ncbi:MAG: hypothetical protein JSR58_06275 [Verrucomicrobia bacterium]|nr:hypothetical protein [Verrucomicrobiota bacterium]
MDGVIVGCDAHMEWMLPWWWSHYSKFNHLPVAFVDWGMSEMGREFCAKRGMLLDLQGSFDFIRSGETVEPHLAESWEEAYAGDVWGPRQSWFRKPFAMAQTPFERTLWVDLDCEVIGSLSHLFNKIHPHSGIAIAQEEGRGYNSGVVVYHRDSLLLKQWMDGCIHFNHTFMSDQDVLSFIIESDHIEIALLPEEYNWRMKHGISLDAVIIHWVGHWGKEVIKRLASKLPEASVVKL